VQKLDICWIEFFFLKKLSFPFKLQSLNLHFLLALDILGVYKIENIEFKNIDILWFDNGTSVGYIWSDGKKYLRDKKSETFIPID